MNSAEVLIKFKSDTSDVDKDTKKLTSSMGGLTKSMTIANLASSAITKGIGLMTQNMDRAIQRIDTMNNFPKVMQNFGISADEASASIKRIDKSVQGLPTSLDQAVAGVQDLFMVTKDLKESEKMFKAVNDSAMVFANGSTEAVDRFIYGYKQALSAGKVSAQDFNQMNEAIPGLMSKVADKMGVTYKELKTGLSDGSISIEKFNSTLKLLDTEGVGSMEALEKSAKTATGGIETSIANMKTAFVRGVASIITTIDKSLSSFGGLSGVITKVGKVGEQAFKVIGSVLEQVMPILLEFGSTIMPVITDGIKQIAPLLQKLGEALLPAIKKIMEKLAPVIAHVMEKVLPIIVDLLDAILPLLDPIANFIVAYIDYFMVLIDPLLEIAQVILPPLIKILSKLAKGILPIMTGWIKILTGVIKGTWNVLKAVINFIKSNWKGLLLVIVAPFVGAFKLLYDKCSAFRNFINNFIEGIKNFIGTAIQNIVSFFQSLPTKIGQAIDSVINFIKKLPENIGFAIGYIEGTVYKFVTQDIPNFITSAINFIKELPVKIMSVMVNIATSVANWFVTAKNNVINKTIEIVNGIINWFRNLPGNLMNIFSSVLSFVGNWLSNMYNKCKSSISNLVSSIVNWFKGLPGQMLNIGKDIVHGMWKGISGAKDWIINKITGFGSSVIKGFKKALKIGSPSKLMAQEVGQWIPKGIAVGIDDNAKSVFRSMQELTNGIGLDTNMTNSMQNSFSPNVQVYNNVNVEQDPLGQMVRTIKTYSGGSPNDYNYGAGY